LAFKNSFNNVSRYRPLPPQTIIKSRYRSLYVCACSFDEFNGIVFNLRLDINEIAGAFQAVWDWIYTNRQGFMARIVAFGGAVWRKRNHNVLHTQEKNGRAPE
jgi:hypothetical protein